nr:MAG TPA: Cytosine specific methyltransferase [Caudoviricetes sp.]
MTTLGSLFTGYGGLDMGVMTALDPSARVAWTSDIEAGPCKLAATRWPDTPNLGDITAIDWANAEPVDIICGGSPCQDLSVAGKRAGMAPGTRSGLWESMFAAIKTIRPRLVVWENVQGALSARSNSSVEHRPGMLGNEPARPTVRAAGRVVGDLATIGYDACWSVVRAADAGAPHRRARLFVIGYPHGEPWGLRGATGPSKAARGRALGHPTRPGVGVRSLRGGNRPMGNHCRARSTSAVNGITPPRRKPAAIRPVRRVAYGPARRTRHRRGPSTPP